MNPVILTVAVAAAFLLSITRPAQALVLHPDGDLDALDLAGFAGHWLATDPAH
jgi:hypothetical protein